MKKFWKYILLPLLAVSLSSCVSNVSYQEYAEEDKYLIGSQTYEGVVKELNIDWRVGKIQLQDDTCGDCNRISFWEDDSLLENQKVRTYFHDGILDVKFWKSGYSSILPNSSSKNLTIQATSYVFQKLNIKLTSGSFNHHADITAEEAKIEITSGKVHLGELNTKKFEYKQTSGEFTIERLFADEAELEMTSGNIHVSGVLKTKKFESKQTSGSLKIGQLYAEEADIEMTSGTFKSFVAQTTEKVNIEFSSGKAEISVGTNATFYVSKSSGDVHCEKEARHPADGVYYIGEGGTEFNVKFTSGSLYIK